MKFIITQIRNGIGFTVSERQNIGEIEVYVEVCAVTSSVEADRIATAMNAQERR